MERTAAGRLGDLLAAAEPVGDDERVGRGLPDLGKEDPLADREGDVVVRLLEAERARHPATAGVRDREVEADPRERAAVGLDAEERPLVAVELNESRPRETSRGELRRVPLQELREEDRRL